MGLRLRVDRVRAPRRLAATVALVATSVVASAGAAPTTTLPDGTRLWVGRYDGPSNVADFAEAVVVSPDGARVFVTGRSYGESSGSDFGTVAHDASTGARLWSRRFSTSDDDRAASIAVSPDGTTVFVAGSSSITASGSEYATIAYDASTGARMWRSIYDGPVSGHDGAASLAVSPDGATVVVTGSSVGSTSGGDFATIAYDASTGAELWTRRYNGPGNAFDFARSLAVSPDGTAVVVTGRSDGQGSLQDYATIAYSASTGARLWTSRYNGPGNGADEPSTVDVSPDGTTVFVTGSSYGSTGTTLDYATVAYDASTGMTLWIKRFNGTRNMGDFAMSLAASPDGTKIFVTGYSSNRTIATDYTTIAYAASSGTRLWARQYEGPGSGSEIPSSVGVSPDGTKVFVTGDSSRSTTGHDYATVAYDAPTGATLWVRRYNGPANGEDVATWLAVSADGTVIVTGYSTGATGDVDYATVAYSA